MRTLSEVVALGITEAQQVTINMIRSWFHLLPAIINKPTMYQATKEELLKRTKVCKNTNK